MAGIKVIKPQPGYQLKALSSKADIVIGGGSAGVGKTFVLLLEFLRHIDNPNWGGVIFRRTSPQIRNEGGLWDTSMNIYPHVGAEPKESFLEWNFKKGAKLKFSHLEYEKNVLDWQGSQIPFIGFDELTHFSEKMFFYLLSRNRSTCGVKPYVRATCNPDPESWVAKLIEWWIDSETGLPIPERNGIVRYFIKNGDDYIWGDSEGEVIEKAWHFLEELVENAEVDPKEFVKSITFVSGTVYENKELLSVNPGYLANLLSQDEQTQAQLLKGNWKVIVSDLDIYNYHAFLGAFDNVKPVETKEGYVTADIAGKGSNKFVVGGWRGKELVDVTLMDKSNGPEVIDGIKNMAIKVGAQNRNIVFDADGIGGLVDGFIPGAISFNGGSSPIEIKDPVSGKVLKENYINLKTQCFYRSGDNIGKGNYKISEHVALKMYDTKMTLRQRFLHERKAIKRDKADSDGKLRIISKEAMKAKLNGDSPDLMDMFMMRELLELKPKPKTWVAV
jgi:hypothetical protein